MLNIPEINRKRIVILGGGFAGLKLAKDLANTEYQVVLFDRNNYHQFQPLFYQVATAGIEPSAILFPLRKMFHQYRNVFLRIAEVVSIDYEKKQIHTSAGELDYDFLVIATGADTNYFGLQNISRMALPMKSVAEALSLRNTILNHMEKALVTDNEQERTALMNLVVVGGGPTGTEIAGALAEMKSHIFPKEYSELDISRIKIYLIEANNCLLNGFSETSKQKAKEYLTKLDVEVMLNTQVLDMQDDKLILKNAGHIPTKTLIWAAGIKGNIIPGLPSSTIGPGGRIKTDEMNEVLGVESIYAIGDISICMNEQSPKGYPQVAQVAIQQAKNLANNLKIASNKKFHAGYKDSLKPFHYKDLGSMATIGRNLAVVDLPWLKLRGSLAWYVWMFVHLMSILGVKNKLFIFINWLWSYMTFDQSLRLIIERKK